MPCGEGEIHALYSVGMNGEEKVPADSAARPLVIVCHGLMMHSGQNPVLGMSESFVKAGYDTLRFDFIGSGRSSGSITDMTPLTEVEDLMNIIRHMRPEDIFHAGGNPSSYVRKIILCGHSLGGLVSLLAAARLSGGDSLVSGLILLAPAVNIEADAKAGRVALETFDPDNIPEYVEVWGSRLGRDYFKTAQNLDVFGSMSRYHGPACIIMGDRDRLVTMDFADQIRKALPQAEINVIPHGDHLFSRGLRLKAASAAIEFLSRI